MAQKNVEADDLQKRLDAFNDQIMKMQMLFDGKFNELQATNAYLTQELRNKENELETL